MHLRRLIARNVLSFGSPGVDLKFGLEPCIVVGPNSAGKTNLIRALTLIGDFFTWRQRNIADYRHMGDVQRPFALHVTVQLTRPEIEPVVDFAIASSWTQWRMTPTPDIDLERGGALARQILAERRQIFRGPLSQPITFSIVGTGNPSSPTDGFVRLGTGRNALYTGQMGGLALTPERSTGWSPINLIASLIQSLDKAYPKVVERGQGQRPLTKKDFKTFLKTIGNDWLADLLRPPGQIPKMVSLEQFDLSGYEGQWRVGSPGTDNLRAFLAERGLPDRNLSLAHLLGSVYDRSLVRLSGQRAKPPIRQVPDLDLIPIFQGSYDGSELPESLFRLKNSIFPSDRARYEQLQTDFKRLSSGSNFDVVLERRVIPRTSSTSGVAPVTNFDATGGPVEPEPTGMIASIRVQTSGFDVPVDWGGAGLVELLLALHVSRSVSDSIVLLDEPAMNVHPSKQAELSGELVSIAASQENQLVVITHSPFFVDPAAPERVLRLDRLGEQTVSHRLGHLKAADRATMVKDITRDPKIADSLFAKAVVLVEGDAEEAGLPIWFARLADAVGLTISNLKFISVHGDGHFGAYVDILNAWGIPWLVVGDHKAAKNVRKFGAKAYTYAEDDYSDILKAFCGPELMIALRAINNDPKDPSVAREVALTASPPAPIEAIWAFVKPLAN